MKKKKKKTKKWLVLEWVWIRTKEVEKSKKKEKEEAGGVDNTEAVGSTESEIYNGATELCISVFETPNSCFLFPSLYLSFLQWPILRLEFT